MTDVAEVIVDVPTMQTDIPFTYLVPPELQQVIQAGMRVVVPFGNSNRKVQGFVLNVKNIDEKTQEFELKAIDRVMDISPVLNQEMLALAEEMSQTTMSFKITCLQTMLPSVMKTSYEKYFVLIDEVSEDIQFDVFKGLHEISWTEAEAQGHLPLLTRLRNEDKIEVRYEVLKRNKIKTKRGFVSLLDFEQVEEVRAGIRANAHQQQCLLAVLQTLQDKTMLYQEAQKNYGLTPGTIRSAAEKKWLQIVDVEVQRDPYANHEFKETSAEQLNDEQQTACDEMVHAMDDNQATTFLLQGITGSGKTEVYLQVIAHALDQGKTGILLVPEISLTPQTVRRFKERFGEEVAVLHSGLSEGERYDEWRKIEKKQAHVVVGARSAIFAPLENIGVIVVDEEHEGSYKQEESPRYHARDIAIWRGEYHGCPVVLGSATPSLESRARAQKKVYRHLQLTKRASSEAQLPDTTVIDMRHVIAKGKMQTFSPQLLERMTEKLAREEQIVLLLNRRGYSSFIMCRDCGYVHTCPNCDISLTLHMDSYAMKCHYCGHEEAIPKICPECHSNKIRYYGTGTQKVEEELQTLFPDTGIIRMDVDTTRRKGAHEKLLDTFGRHEASILLGTQMIAKGLDFPNVTLVGVLNADTALNLPDFRSSEKTFQLLTQVSGRAGRGDKPGEVLIQTFNPEHYAIQLAKKHDYESFYQTEMVARHQGNYPPFFFTVQIVGSHEEEITVAKKMYEIAEQLVQSVSDKTIVLGPTPKAVMRVNNRYFYQIVIKYKFESELMTVLKKILNESQQEIQRGLKLTIDMEPLNFI
ncbi:primosomal protein N' [Vagococcus elongatus]|uniref:Replication restart protein PriA n=1 Tax=Vagococcus elongatus TaxID=180344 RepID=A0A430AYL5_9ENTE|nr:primosomal protein N' [Vagococcus elongatus]RSU13134.1 primosomal protein N' [Vagococcus elongatus]